MAHDRQDERFFAWRHPRTHEQHDFQVLVGWRWMAAGLGIIGTMLSLALGMPRQAARLFRPLVSSSLLAGVVAAAVGLRNALFPRLTRVDLPIEGLPTGLDGLRIAHLSDLHLGLPLTRYAVARAVEQARAATPDLILISGDFVSYVHHLVLLPPMLRSLHARYGTYASLGNHDHWTDPTALRHVLCGLGIPLLVNEHRVVDVDGAQLVIAGIDDMWSGQPEVATALCGAPSEAPVIMLAHSPDFADQVLEMPVMLQLAGHSHGGHIRLPGLGPLLLPRHAIVYDHGLHRLGRMWLFVSNGLGGWPLRLGCRAEVALITLRATCNQVPESNR